LPSKKGRFEEEKQGFVNQGAGKAAIGDKHPQNEPSTNVPVYVQPPLSVLSFEKLCL